MFNLIENQVKDFIVDHLRLNDDDYHTGFTMEDMGADMLDELEIVMGLEELFEFETNWEYGEELTPQVMINYFKGKK